MIPQPFKTLAYGAALSALLAGGAMAQTAPGTPVNNTISLNYNTGAGEIELSGSQLPTANFVVDRKVDLVLNSQLSPTDEVTAPSGSTQVLLAFNLENNGNGTQDFQIDVVRNGALNLTASATATDTPDAGEYSVVFSTSDNLSGVIPTPASGNIEGLAAGADIYILIVANIPLTTDDDLEADFTVTATALTDTGGEIIYTRLLGLMGENVIAVDTESNSTLSPGTELSPAEDGIAADQGRIRVSTPMISAEKEVIVVSEDPNFACDDLDLAGNAPEADAGAIPGACIEYTITVENTAVSAAATTINISDELPSQVSHEANSNFVYTVIDGGAAGAGTTSSAADLESDGVTVSGTIGNLPAGERATLRIRATIN